MGTRTKGASNGCARSSADRVPGYEPVGRGFESPRARHEKNLCLNKTKVLFLLYIIFSVMLKVQSSHF